MHDGASKVSGRREPTAWHSTVASVGEWRLRGQPGSIPVSQRPGPAEGGSRLRRVCWPARPLANFGKWAAITSIGFGNVRDHVQH
jgi:hypothetical protein